MARYLDLQRRHEDMLGRLVVTEAARDQAVAASNQNYAALERYGPINDHPDARLLRHQLHTALQALAVAEEFSPSHANIMRAAQ